MFMSKFFYKKRNKENETISLIEDDFLNLTRLSSAGAVKLIPASTRYTLRDILTSGELMKTKRTFLSERCAEIEAKLLAKQEESLAQSRISQGKKKRN